MRLSDLARMRVVDEAGNDLGRLVDVEATTSARSGSAEHAVVRGLVSGSLGILERVGLSGAGGTFLAWRRVARIGRERIVLRSAAAAAARARNKRR